MGRMTMDEFRDYLVETRGTHRANVSIPPGWLDLVIQLDADIADLVPDYRLSQVKEKFAGLRYYLASGIPDEDLRAEVHLLIRTAEHLSTETCEECGTQEGVTQATVGKFWLCTLCPPDRLAAEQRRAERFMER